ncbi:serine/threonine protein kinase and signal transduction histidine kinase with GAF and PAS/PAC sensor [Tolypothrix tenuis PCC 7101]|uniref:Circadian input-output histidine kinase CikA n=1 Tax=Tolypothrix tenuis PCC 7101 TaxID=231146 RepID=A0A1Z4N5A9_9CYAN|nr:AAA family ATPase [Aulosira sp. FACHB-113]BAZ00933.1 serine/threonine protein kinase and signal transduction histidine kinase with GAF and PAS/PAC sensor [Tolypothrix tenuis PCC 7101]BAZ75144.1 serine/threonine protein kinase and signal transduction histidine kinase with GAF and PAS/PAC sensor [Aulosira laxa NIES-50]
MISLPDVTIVSQIYESANSFVYRGIFNTNRQPVILKLLKEDYPTPAELYRYQQEYEITRSLNLEEIIKAYELRKYQNTLLMLLEDFGGESLKILLQKISFSVPGFLNLAIQITDILGRVHQHNIIHKDINPSNIVFNPQTGQLKIIDFGLSTLLSQENLALQSPNVLEGTLAYISPEQTGRINRALDYRTDFYSLGVTFYELLTKQLPFGYDDALELVHCHVAKQPLSPHEINPEIPINLSEIIMKLMAKMPEERYQSTWGIKADLETCLTQCQNGAILRFTLGCQDICHQLQIPEKLYGRESQIESLLTAFERTSLGKTELMLISGYSGIGKSALVHELYKLITEKRGYFISGKFDQLHRDIPYQALVAAFQELVRQLLTENELQLQQWREKILAALGANGQIIIDVIPEVELIIGKQPAVPELPFTEAQNRFNLVFQNFIQVFCQKEHPLVIFLDDLQWTDSATLQLLQLIMTHTNSQYLFLIGAYRDNEVSATHPAMLTVAEMNQQGLVVNHLSLSPLNFHQINEFIAETLKTNCIHTQKFAQLVWEKTQGNPFFIKEFIKSLYADKLLKFDTNAGSWSWDLERIINSSITDNVVELMTEKIQRLSDSAQKVLKLAACIGNSFDLKTLAVINERTQKETAKELLDAMQAGLILPIGDDYKFMQTDRELHELKITYKFAHDRIQQAAYFLIPVEEKQAVHWRVGQLLLQNTPPQLRQQKIFDIVNQLNLGIATVNVQEERDKIVQLNLIAGKKAKASAAWKTAGNYFRIGRNCLSADSWQSQYDLTLVLYVEAAEVASSCGNFEEMEKLVGIVLQKANSLLDKVKVYQVKIQAYTSQNNPRQAIDTALSVLKMLGIYFPKKPNKIDILLKLVKTKLSLTGKEIEALIELPEMTDPYKLAAMRILSDVVAPAYFAIPELFALIVFEQVNLSLKYGNTATSCYAYATYGLILSGEVIGDIEAGYQFGQLALKLLDKFNAKELKARIFFVVNFFIKHWKEHIKETLTPLRDAYVIGLETGDVEYAAYAATSYTHHAYILGQELAKLEPEMAMYANSLKQLGQETGYYYIQINRQLILNLMGQAEDNCRLIGESYDEDKMLPIHLEANAQNICHYLYFYKIFLGYLFQDYQQALKYTRLVEESQDSAVGSIPLADFYISLIYLAIYADASKSEQKRIQKQVKAKLKNLKKWAHFAPMTHLQKFSLVQAELHRVLGEHTQAIDCYDLAIALAKENDYLNEEALANELTAKFYLNWGKAQVAQGYLINAYHCYLRWGAIAKVKDLEQQYPQLLQRFTKTNISLDSRHSIPSTSGSTAGEVLDLAALMKAAVAIASEIELDKLLATLMRILLSSAGAQTGYLILESLGELRVEASGEANSEQILVLQSTPIETCLPASIIYYVARTQEGLIESNVARDGRFTQDKYIKQYQPKSILCAPLLNQGQLIGIVYLENNLADDVFTADRLKVIQMLSTQAAIALNNARLYTQVQSTQNRLNKFLNAIPLGISVHDAKGQLVYANQVSQQLLKIQDLVKAEAEQLAQAYRIYRAETGQMYPLEQLPIVRSLGGEKTRADDLELHYSELIVPLEVTSTPIFDETGNVEYAIAAFQDISDRKQAQKTLIENVRLEQEISERKKIEAELEQAKDAAETANRAKSTFLANMSHELRTPLNAILGFSQLMNQDANLSTGQKENLEIIHRSGEHLLALINQVLDLSKVEAGRMVLSTTNFDLYYLLADIEDMFALKAKDKNLQLQFDCALNVPQYICTDEMKLRQVLINLISNAIKFTSFGSVSVKVAINADMQTDSGETTISFEVTDTGVGIAPEELKNLFQPFVQTSSGQQLQQGTGLGLTISREFVRLMGGEITVMSSQGFYPSGTTFKFDIPVGIAEECVINNPSKSDRIIALAPNQPQYRILVVDDKDYNRQLLVKLLKPLGFAVQEANNGEDAIKIWDEYSPHLIWMDMRMPIMDGYEATKRIKSTTKGQATVIIALTASAWEEEKTVILSAGCDDFVRKPFYTETIFEMMAKHLGVRYIYQEKEPSSHHANVNVEPLNLTNLFAEMPKSWIINLHESALDADAELVLQILDSVPESHALVRHTCKNWVKRFQFENILDLTEPLITKH